MVYVLNILLYIIIYKINILHINYCYILIWILEIRYKLSSRACFSTSKENWRNQSNSSSWKNAKHTHTPCHGFIMFNNRNHLIYTIPWSYHIKSLQTHNFTTIHQWNDTYISENLSINILNIKIVHIIEDWNCKFWQVKV